MPLYTIPPEILQPILEIVQDPRVWGALIIIVAVIKEKFPHIKLVSEDRFKR